MANVTAAAVWQWLVLVVAVAVYVTGLIWMLIDVLRRPDFSTGRKVLWVAAATVFSLVALVVYVAAFRGWDDPLQRDS